MLYSDLAKATMDNGQQGGCECQYHRISATEGIKVFYSPRSVGDKMYEKYYGSEECTNGTHMKDVERQVALMTELSSAGRAPKPYEILIIQNNSYLGSPGHPIEYYPAIRMEHIEHCQINSDPRLCNAWDKQSKVHKGRNSWIKCMQKRFELSDSHEGNIVWVPSKRQFMILDYGDVKERPDYSKGR
jgi:hypothetical protein